MNAPLRKAKPYIFHGQTTSLCATCRKPVPAKILISGDEVWYEKRCRDHGVQKVLVSSDAAYWKAELSWLKPGDRPLQVQTRTDYGCPFDCGLCPDHEQHSCLAIIEVNEACNLTCPVCFAGSSQASTSHRDLATIGRMMDALVASEGEPDLLQLSGGEPTIHPDILTIIDMAKARPIRHLMINTNGLRIATDPAFVKELEKRKKGLEIYLQFDSLDPAALVTLRGADLTKVRRRALDALEAAGISTTLVCTVKKGLNDREMAAIIGHALSFSCVRGVTFQPIQDAGRNEDFDARRDRVLLSDIRRRVVEDSGVFGEADMIPLPCNPTAISIGYGLRNGRSVVPVTAMIPKEQIIAEVPNAVNFERYPMLKERIFDLFSLSTIEPNVGERLGDLLCCLPQVEVPKGLSYENIFRVVIVNFMDAHDFCVANVKRSCIHFVTPAGQIIPFETYNLFYRDGSVAKLREMLE
ncbi:MAG: radical SAM protein [Notoacmeibacter sp.]|nr:radical SAM protein [Notoacmeibacter sp.]